MIVWLFVVLPLHYSKVVQEGNILLLQLEVTPTRLAQAAAYTGPYEQYISTMQRLITNNNFFRIQFLQKVDTGGNPTQLRAELLVTSAQSTSNRLPVTTPVTDVSTLYK